MPRYIQSKIRDDGATGAKFTFYAGDMEEVRERVRTTIPHLRTFYDAVALVIQDENNEEEPVLLLNGRDW